MLKRTDTSLGPLLPEEQRELLRAQLVERVKFLARRRGVRGRPGKRRLGLAKRRQVLEVFSGGGLLTLDVCRVWVSKIYFLLPERKSGLVTLDRRF